MRPSPACCIPHQAQSPSGLAWVHHYDCKVAPRQKIRLVRDLANARRSESHQRETQDAGVVLPITAAGHPAGTRRPCADCKTAAKTGVGVVHRRCAWLLELDTPEAAEFDAHLDDGTSA